MSSSPTRHDRVVLPEFTLDIPAGQTIALVGSTGAGKSTLAKLISRFYDPTKGTVVARRRRPAQAAPEGPAPRDRHGDPGGLPVLRHASPTTSRSASRRRRATRSCAAAKAVGAHEFIESLPNGYDTDVNKRGGRVSAGQRQLLSFARAFIADPVVLILDEATASLDIPSERLVQEGLQTLLSDRTAIIIAHRLSTVAIADRVLVMEHGRDRRGWHATRPHRRHRAGSRSCTPPGATAWCEFFFGCAAAPAAQRRPSLVALRTEVFGSVGGGRGFEQFDEDRLRRGVADVLAVVRLCW